MRPKTPSSSFILLEIRNALYEYAALPNGVDPEKRAFMRITEDTTIASSDTVRSFFLDTISEGGKSALFAKNIIEVTEIAQEVHS